MIKHIVMWKFKDEANGQTKEEIMTQVQRDLTALKGIIPEILSMEIGRDVLRGEPSYDMALILEFADMAALQTYIAHPEHQKVSAYITASRNERAVADLQL